MKKFSGISIFVMAIAIASPANAATVKYKNCKALNKVHPSGVAKPGAQDTKKAKGKKVAVTTNGVPTYDGALYKKNKGLDRDKDGIACEK
jgi:hypothetical protein